MGDGVDEYIGTGEGFVYCGNIVHDDDDNSGGGGVGKCKFVKEWNDGTTLVCSLSGS